jgi:DNA repair exonuclease SbcCD ATPase subunit
VTSPNQASVGNVHADIVPDVSGFKTALKSKLGALRLDPVNLRVDADTKAAEATLSAFRKTASRPIDIPIDIDTRRAATRLATFRTTASRPIDIPLDVSTRAGAASLTNLRRTVRDTIKIPVDLDTSAAAASYAALRAVISSTIDIHVDIDTRTAAASLAAFIAAYRSAIAGLPPIRPGGAGGAGRSGAADGGAYAAAFRVAVAQASRDLPPFRVTLNRDPVQRAINGIQQDLARLANQRVGIDISADDAIAEARRIRVELARLQAISPIDVDVQADARAAQLALIRLEAQLANIGRDRTTDVRVRTDHSQLTGLQAALLGSTSRMQLLVTAGLALGPAIVPAAAAAAAAIAGIGGAAISAVAGLGVGVLALSGVVGGVRALNEARAEQARTNATLTKQDAQLASGADQVRSAVASLANTRAQAASQARQSANSIADAERSLADAQRDALRAQQDITRAREEAKDALEDLDSAVKNNALSIRQANLDLAESQERLNKVLADPSATRRQREEAQLAYDRARQNLDDLTVRQGRLKEEQQESAKAGVEGSKQVTAAQERIRDAQARVADAERALKEARIQAAEQARQSAFSIAQAQQAVVAAQRSAATAVASSAATAGGALDELNRKMDALSPAGQRFVRFIAGIQPELLTLRRNAEQALPGFQRGLESLLPTLPAVNDFIRRMALSLGQLGKDIGETLTSNRVRPFFTYLDATAVPTMDSLARSTGRVGIGLANMVVAFGPVQRQIVGGLDDMSKRFEAFSAGLASNNGFQDFLDYAITRGPIVLRTIGDIGGAIVHLLEASAPAGDVLLTVLSTISRVIEAIPVPVLTVLLGTLTALRVAALLAAIPFGAIGSTLATLPGRIIAMTTSVGAAQAGFASFAATIGGPVTIAIAAATLGIGAMIAQSAKQRAEVDRLKSSFDAYGAALKDGVNRESLANAQAILRQDAGLRGLVATMQQLNISQDTLVKGLNGDRDARKTVIDAINLQIEYERQMQREARGSSDAETEASLAHKKRAEELERQRIAFAKVNTANAEANDLTRRWAEETNAAGGAISIYAQKIDVLERLYGTLSDRTATAKDISEAFRRAIDDLTGSTINAIEAEERQIQTQVDLRKNLADSSAGFDLATAKTDANRAAVLRNRDALEAALTATREKMLADIAAGVSLEEARAANERRIAEILKEIPATQRNTATVDQLVAAYGRVPDEVATAMKVTGAEAVLQQLKNLKIAQLALDANISIADAKARIESQNQYRVFAATGGPVYGPGGPTDDRVRAVLHTPGHDPIRYQLSPGEFIQPAASVDYYGQGFHEAIRRRAIPRDMLPGVRYRATGGPVEEWDFPTNVSGTYMPTLEQIKAQIAAKKAAEFGAGPGFPPWPSSPGASRGDSGVWRSIVALIRSTGPLSGSFGNAYRHGDPLWHGCVPMDTEVLTRRGWIRYDQVRIGVDETVGYNPRTGRNEWTRIVGMYRYQDAELWTITDGEWCAEITPGHRWLTNNGMVETRNLTAGNRIQTAAPLAEDIDAAIGLVDGRREVGNLRTAGMRHADVYCPTTELGTWTARQNGEVFLTGNSGRAVDWMGYNQDALANFFMGMQGRLLEFIHRTGSRDYAVTRGRNRGSFSERLMNEHRNHIHVAMADGGLVQVPRIKYDSGGVLPPGLTLADNQTGRYETVRTAAQEAALGRGGRGGVSMHIDEFHAHGDQSPGEIAKDLYWQMITR